MKKLYLVRHAQSQSNVDYEVLQKTPNPAINLSEAGRMQAAQAGRYLQSTLGPSVVWNSPYYRTRETAKAIKSQLTDYIERESIHIAERQFGLVDDVADYKTIYRDEANHYSLHSKHKVNFFARPPLGESPYDMCLRLDQFINTEIETSTHDTHVAVTHGAAIRGILMMTLRWNYELYDEEPNSPNAGIRLLEKDGTDWVDRGYVFKPKNITY